MEKVMEKSWNVMEFGFENCVGTLVNDYCRLLRADRESVSFSFSILNRSKVLQVVFFRSLTEFL